MSELDIAVRLGEAEVVRSILSQNLCNLHEVDENGDQPAHIAARMNREECMRALIEHDARMGRKNFCGLTPLGEAQMHGHGGIAALIRNNYYESKSPGEDYVWHDEFSRETAAWYDVWDEERQKLRWARLGPDGKVELSATPPPVDIQRVIMTREACHERKVVRRIHPKSLMSMRQRSYDEQRRAEREKLVTVLKGRGRLVEERCATKLQAHLRRARARRLAEQKQRERAAATRLQRRFRYFIGRKKERSAILIQSVVRMHLTRTYFRSHHHERLWWYRASRRLARHAQRLWRGHQGRAQFREVHAMTMLPDPTDMRNFDFWEARQREAQPPKRELGIFAEHTLGGTPRSWEDRARKWQGVFFRDVSFYANTITKRASWEKPKVKVLVVAVVVFPLFERPF